MAHPFIRRGVLATLMLSAATVAWGQEAPATRPAKVPVPDPVAADVCYRPESTDELVKRTCVLDIYQPAGGRAKGVVVWFHGGNLTGGDKAEARKVVPRVVNAGFTLVTANYRLSPKVTYPAYVEDAAAVLAWVMDHPDRVGTTADHVFVAGYSAGGFLATAVGTQPQWLAAVGHSNHDLRGIIGVSPQVFTHYTIREERGIKDPTNTPVIDSAAPIFFAAADLPPIQLFVGDKDMATRREELEYFMAVLKAKKHPDATLTLTPNRTHGTMTNFVNEPTDPMGTRLIEFLNTHADAPTTRPATAVR